MTSIVLFKELKFSKTNSKISSLDAATNVNIDQQQH